MAQGARVVRVPLLVNHYSEAAKHQIDGVDRSFIAQADEDPIPLVLGNSKQTSTNHPKPKPRPFNVGTSPMGASERNDWQRSACGLGSAPSPGSLAATRQRGLLQY